MFSWTSVSHLGFILAPSCLEFVPLPTTSWAHLCLTSSTLPRSACTPPRQPSPPTHHGPCPCPLILHSPLVGWRSGQSGLSSVTPLPGVPGVQVPGHVWLPDCGVRGVPTSLRGQACAQMFSYWVSGAGVWAGIPDPLGPGCVSPAPPDSASDSPFLPPPHPTPDLPGKAEWTVISVQVFVN